ncbi:hypothetical protein CHARACLAT_011386 [Characodon lateralis]|uniref:Uncharacterized protein n=1 Tax=Characodon lateralis TaxID=208331 RepID=A0ABU7E1B0_9TELE|nr:hypothetical protein [Characodon lateralis]
MWLKLTFLANMVTASSCWGAVSQHERKSCQRLQKFRCWGGGSPLQQNNDLQHPDILLGQGLDESILVSEWPSQSPDKKNVIDSLWQDLKLALSIQSDFELFFM